MLHRPLDDNFADAQIEGLERCDNYLEKKSAGFIDLDPTMPRRGRLVRRWNLRVNRRVDSSATA